ncbi:hypothetical protein [Thiomonas arsenitoxydans]|nr:hypothetical protein [Thiomonas arsenitoxydans]
MATIRWHEVSREDLLDVLLGEPSSLKPSISSFPSLEVKGGKLAVAYAAEAGTDAYLLPTLVVLGNEFAADTLSWLRVYADEVSPISQFARVVLASDWSAFGEATDSLRRVRNRADRWACVAVGEALAQSDGDSELQAMPLSRVSSCFSIPIGRTNLLFGDGNLVRQCVDRLRTVSQDQRLGRRTLSVDQLLPVLAIAGSAVLEDTAASEAALLVVEAASTYFAAFLRSPPLVSFNQLKNYPGLSSDSIEERVVAFNRLSLEVLNQDPSQFGETIAPVLAAAAFLVGRGTSHVFLLKRFGRVAPVAFAWFGVIAALAGPRAWDGAWLRAVKGAERLLRPNFDWLDAPSADIGWAEFSWLSSTFDGVEQLAGIPKMLPRTLSIEIVPGAIIQVRLGTGSADIESRVTSEAKARERALQEALTQFVSLAQRVKNLVEKQPVQANEQQTLGLESESIALSTKGARSRRRRDSSST